MNLETLVNELVDQLSALMEKQAMERARVTVLSALDAPPRRGPGRPPKAAAAIAFTRASGTGDHDGHDRKPRKKAPLQLCPVPGCKNPAAPVFGMVCAKHKDLPKAKIKQF